MAKLQQLRPLFAGGHLSEWGAPQGSFGRLWPLLIASSLRQRTLWLSDEPTSFYPPSWYRLGFSSQQIHFLSSPEPHHELREVMRLSSFPVVICDAQHKVRPQEYHFLRQQCRAQEICLFILRPFRLSPCRGNPFCQTRWNTFLQKEPRGPVLSLSCLKGPWREELHLELMEVMGGTNPLPSRSARREPA